MIVPLALHLVMPALVAGILVMQMTPTTR